MDGALATTIVSTAGSVIVGIFGMFFTANQLGKRMDDTNARINRLRDEFRAFKDGVMGELSAIDSEIAKLMDKR